MKKTVSLIIGAVLFIIFFNFQSEKGESSKKIGFVVSSLDNPFFVTLKEGVEKKSKEMGVELIILDSQNDPVKELTNVEDLMVKGVDVILLNPADSDAAGSAVATANRNNIPVITLDRGVNKGEVVTHIASDSILGGKMAGKFILEKIGEGGKVVELEGIPGTTAARDRGQGFNESVKGKLQLVGKQSAGFDRTEGLDVMEDILQGIPDIDAVFAHNDQMALGALKAIEESGRTILVVGFDAVDEAVEAVRDGRMGATIAQQPDIIGSLGVETAIKVINGEKTENYIPVELKIVR